MNQQQLDIIWDRIIAGTLLNADIQPRVITNDAVEQSMSVPDANGVETGPWVRRPPNTVWESMKLVGEP